MKFLSYFSILTILLSFYSCYHDDKTQVKNNIDQNDSLVEAVGVLMNSDTLEKPIIFPEAKPTIVKAGKPKPSVINSNGNIEAGLSYIKNYTTDQGLPLDAVSVGDKSMIIDRHGNMWICTLGAGVTRFDGKYFTTFTTLHGLVDNNVNCVLEDRQGNIWFGTNSSGLSCYDGKSFKNFPIFNRLGSKLINCIYEDDKGNIWIGVSIGGAFCFDGKSFKNYSTKEGFTDRNVKTIIQDKTGNIWFGSNNGLFRFNGKTFTKLSIKEELKYNNVITSTIDKKGNLWFGTAGNGVICFDGKSFTYLNKTNGLAADYVSSIKEDKNGNIWFGTLGGGTSCYNGKSFVNYNINDGLSNDNISSIIEDKKGNIWFGSYGGGISLFYGNYFKTFNTSHGLNNNISFCIEPSKNGNLWIGSYGGGIAVYDGKSFLNYSTEQGLLNNSIFSLLEDSKKNIWIGYSGSGVTCFNGTSFAHYVAKQGFAQSTIFKIIEDKKGNIWFSSWGGEGAWCFNGHSFTNYTTKQGLLSNNIYTMTEDKTGKIWFATDLGISCFDGSFFKQYTKEDGLPNGLIISIKEDNFGNIWFGSNGNGIARFDGKNFKTFTVENGLPHNSVTNIEIDNKENLIIGTNLGIGILTSFKAKSNSNLKNVNAVNSLSNNELKNYTPMIEVYNTQNDFPIKDINGGKTIYCEKDGNLWLATGSDKTALVRFNYPKYLENKSNGLPKVVLHKIKINDETICWNDLQSKQSAALEKSDSLTPSNIVEEINLFDKVLTNNERESMILKYKNIQFKTLSKFYVLPQDLVLPYEHNSISFQFATIDPAQLINTKQYQYILEGYNTNWTELTNKNEANYTNLPEGSYIFKVKAVNNNGIWSKPITYTFKVLPPLWRTWWMYVIYLLLLITLIILFIWLDGKQLRKRAHLLKHKVSEATRQIHEQKYLIEQKHKEIKDSINHAERIQRTFLATFDLLDKYLQNYFIIFKPKDVVSGDFYWADVLPNGNFVLTIGDSTGHGVPGAIMSLLNIMSLEKAIENITDPAGILNHTRKTIINRLKRDGSEEGGKDGMDGSLIVFDFKEKKLFVAAAINSIWIIRNNELIEIKGDRIPIGKHHRDTEPFTLHTFHYQEGDMLYALTDGYPDQFGGPKEKKFGYKQLKELLLSVHNEPNEIQKQKLIEVFENWKGNLEQVDDVCLVGIKL